MTVMPDGDKPGARQAANKQMGARINQLKTRLSTKGQVILPKAVRDRHGWTAGTELQIVDGPDGVTLRPARPFPPTRPEDVRGILKYDGPPISIEDMDAAITEEVRDRIARGRY
jgi:AbrB family looped-hinge helix DNA binding protein